MVKHRLLIILMLFSAPLFIGCVHSPSNVNVGEFDKMAAAKARIELALGYLAQDDFVKAKQNLDRAYEHNPNYYLVHSALAYFQQRQGNPEQAQKSYQQALKLDQNQGDVRNNYATLLCQQGDFDNAYHQFELALQTPHYYRHTDTLENLILCAFAEKNEDLVAQYLSRLDKIDNSRSERLRAQLMRD